MQQDAQVMREKERYLTWTRSTRVRDRRARSHQKAAPRSCVVVYLGYDLLPLRAVCELLALTTKYEEILPKDAALPVSRVCPQAYRDLDQAEAAFTRSHRPRFKVPTVLCESRFRLTRPAKGRRRSIRFSKLLSGLT